MIPGAGPLTSPIFLKFNLLLNTKSKSSFLIHNSCAVSNVASTQPSTTALAISSSAPNSNMALSICFLYFEASPVVEASSVVEVSFSSSLVFVLLFALLLLSDSSTRVPDLVNTVEYGV